MKTFKEHITESVGGDHPLHADVSSLGFRRKVHPDPETHEYNAKTRVDHSSIEHKLKASGYKLHDSVGDDEDGSHTMHYYRHPSGHNARVDVHDKTKKVKHIESWKDDEDD